MQDAAMQDAPMQDAAIQDARMKESIRAWAENLAAVEAINAARRVPRETAASLDDMHRLRALGMEGAERNERQARGLLTMAEQDAAVRCDTGLRFVKIARAVRQIIVLEQETMGTRPMPPGRAAHEVPAAASRPRTEEKPAASASQASDASPQAAAGEDAAGEPQRNDTRERSDLRDRADLRDREEDDLYDYDDGPMEQVLAGLRKVVGDTAVGDAAVGDAGGEAVRGGSPGRGPERRPPPDGFAATPQARRGPAEFAGMVRERGPP
jgi:hypothetical protein